MNMIESAPTPVVAMSAVGAALKSAAYEVVVYIGRFEPFHLGHLAMLRRALEAGQIVVVVLGSAFRARDPKNPLQWKERVDMIQLCLTEEERSRVLFVPMRDYYDDDRWVAEAEKAVGELVPWARNVALIGHFKDASSEYLNRFRSWKLLDEPRHTDVDATTVRRLMFQTEGQPQEAMFRLLRDMVPEGTLQYLSAWWNLPHWARMVKQQGDLTRYNKERGDGPFYTGDALVTCADRILLLQRGSGQGEDLFCLPGGFVKKHQTGYQAAVAELDEETGLKFYGDGLKAYLKGSTVFDAPGRDLRARIITHMFWFDLGDRSCPEVHAADDAKPGSAVWKTREEVIELEDRFYADHFHGIDHFLHLTH